MKTTHPVALVTGSNKGIGFEVVKQLADKDYTVILTARDLGRGKLAWDALHATYPNVVFLPLDVTSSESIAALASSIESDFGRLDVLVNNAGVALDKFVPALELDTKTLRATMETNVYGAFEVTKALAPLMKKTPGGRIVMLSSMLGSLETMTGLTLAYRMSKTAINTLTRVLADELKDSGILVNALCPGWVRTELGGDDAPVTPTEAAACVVELALLQDDGPSGQFFREGKNYPW